MNTPTAAASDSPLDVLPLLGRPMVALMPFVACGPGAALRQLGDDIADRLRVRLAADPDLGAILISSKFLSEAPAHALELICRELRVGHLISGRCHPTGNEPSLYVELTDLRYWHVRWAQFYRLGARSLLADDGEVISGVVRSLRNSLVERRHR